MSRNELRKKYFDWMCRLVYDKRYSKRPSYRKLFNHLNEIDFYYIMLMDENRGNDGIDLRYRFGYEYRLDEPMISSYLDDRPCSVLEMLVALALRCEEQIMDDVAIGSRTNQWFWEMIHNLGLKDMTDNQYDENYVEDVISKFLNRDYDRNGNGGLFTIKKTRIDQRKIEIWYQMCSYLNDAIDNYEKE